MRFREDIAFLSFALFAVALIVFGGMMVRHMARARAAFYVPVIEAPPGHRVGEAQRPARVIAGVPAYLVRYETVAARTAR